MSETIHLHKNIVDRKRNTLFLFLPTILFVSFLVIMFSIYKAQQLPQDAHEVILGEEVNIDNGNRSDRQ